MDQALKELGGYIRDTLGSSVEDMGVRLGELTITIRRDDLLKVMKFLKDDANCQFLTLLDVCGVDYPDDDERFEIVYHMLSMTHNNRIRVKLRTNEDTPVDSVTGLFNAANWWEREVWDMFGVAFNDHPDLRRLLKHCGGAQARSRTRGIECRHHSTETTKRHERHDHPRARRRLFCHQFHQLP